MQDGASASGQQPLPTCFLWVAYWHAWFCGEVRRVGIRVKHVVYSEAFPLFSAVTFMFQTRPTPDRAPIGP